MVRKTVVKLTPHTKHVTAEGDELAAMVRIDRVELRGTRATLRDLGLDICNEVSTLPDVVVSEPEPIDPDYVKRYEGG